MNIPPDVHSTNIWGKIKRDDNATDDSVNGLSVPLQFVINNEPHLSRTREQKKLVRSHAKRQSRAVEKRRNTMPVQRREILQKRFYQSAAQSDSSITKANANVGSIPSKSVIDQKLVLLSVLVRNPMNTSRQSQVILLVRIGRSIIPCPSRTRHSVIKSENREV